MTSNATHEDVLVRSADVLADTLYDIPQEDQEFAQKRIYPYEYSNLLHGEYEQQRQDDVRREMRWNDLMLLLFKLRWSPYIPETVKQYQENRKWETVPGIFRWGSSANLVRVIYWLSMLLCWGTSAFLYEFSHSSQYFVIVPILSGLGGLVGLCMCYLSARYGDVKPMVWSYQKMTEFLGFHLPSDVKERVDVVSKEFPEVTFCFHVMWEEKSGFALFPMLALHVSFGVHVRIYYLEAWGDSMSVIFPRKAWSGLLKEKETIYV